METEKSSASTDRASALQETLLAVFGLGEPDESQLVSILERFPPEDVAQVLTDLDYEQKLRIFNALSTPEQQGIVLEETDQQTQREILEELSEKERHGILGELHVDDLVDHLEALPEAEQRRLIAKLGDKEAQYVEELLQYEPDTAGGIMTTDFITIPSGTSGRDALAKIQGNLRTEFVNYLYVTDEANFLRGVVSLREVLCARPEARVDTYMKTDVVKVNVRTDQEEVAALVDKYHWQAIPVVDDFDRIRGIVTFDDVMEAVQEEHSEDMLRMAGTTAVHPLYEPLKVDVAKRLPFLMVTMFGGLVVALIQGYFRDEIIGLALFSTMVIWVHLVGALSGNVAVVTSTVMVRGLATGEVALRRLRRAVLRELFVSVCIACILASITALAFYLYSRISGTEISVLKAITALGIAMVASLSWAGLVGGLVPVVCRLTKFIDPAIASGPFVTITCDISASLIFLLFIYLLLGPA